MKLLQALRNAAKHMAADFEDSRLFDHSGDKGEFREYMIGKLLRPFLPECYGIGSGQVFAADGEASHQIDVVLYDTIFSNVLFRDASNSLFPCESVYGTIEVKSRLSTEELHTSISNIASVKRLNRAPTDGLDILPMRRFPRIGSGLKYTPNNVANPYLGIVFAYDGLTADGVISVLHEYLAAQELPPEHLPNFVCCYKRGFLLWRIRADDFLVPFGEPAFAGYGVLYSGSDTLPLFYLSINICLNSIRLNVTFVQPESKSCLGDQK
jgi:hypothetical protein